MPKTDKPKSPEKGEEKSSDWGTLVSQTQDAPEIYPKLKFGDDKLSEVSISMEILASEPRFAEYESQFTGEQERAMFLPVKVLDGPETGKLRSLGMPADPEHALTRGIVTVAKRHANDLKGVFVSIETKNYIHKKYGKTRGYTVSEIEPPAPVRESAPAQKAEAGSDPLP